MTPLHIAIHRQNQKEPVFGDIAPFHEKELILERAAILEGGTDGGNASVTFFAIDPETRRYYSAQITAALLESLVGAIHGAKAHWLENPVENIWKDKI